MIISANTTIPAMHNNTSIVKIHLRKFNPASHASSIRFCVSSEYPSNFFIVIFLSFYYIRGKKNRAVALISSFV
nr:MAG TPA: hypothetical protein [Caudoviricetes sp.]